MAWSVADLSAITDELTDLLQIRANSAPFPIKVSGAMPETVRGEGTCQLTLYLLHISQDKYQRNTPVGATPAQPNRSHPLGLDLYYLLTAYAGKEYRQEQQAMSIAMQFFHENAIFKPPGQEYTLTMEAETADEIARLWQALSTPLRLSAVYKASVVFIAPSQPPVPAAGPPPTQLGLAVSPTRLPPLLPSQLFGAAVRVDFNVPPGATAEQPDKITAVVSPPVALAGSVLTVGGAGLDNPASANVYLSLPGGVEYDISPWKTGPVSASELRLDFRNTVGTPPAASPPPGVYLLTVGSDAPTALRSNAIPISVAARIDGVAVPPLLSPDGFGVYHVQGAGFTTALTEVFIGETPLTRVSGLPGSGQFQVDPSAASFQFMPPSPFPPGRYYLRVRVNQIDSPPSWYLDL